MDDITPIERFLLVQAIFSKAAEAVSTKGTDNLRSEVDDGFRAEYERTGGKSFSLRFGGEKVGTYSISESKGTPPTERTVLDLKDDDAFAAWLETNDGQLACKWYADENAQAFADWYVGRTGELPDGVEPRTVRTNGTIGGAYKGASLRGFDADRVLSIATGMGLLPTRVAGLIGGGEDA